MFPTFNLISSYAFYFCTPGAIKDSLLGEHKLAQFFLVVLNSAEEYRCWENLKDAVSERSLPEKQGKCSVDSDSYHRSGKQYSSDHTQVIFFPQRQAAKSSRKEKHY